MIERAEIKGDLDKRRIERLAGLAEHEHGDLAQLYARERAKTAKRLGSDRASAEWHAAERELRREEDSD